MYILHLILIEMNLKNLLFQKFYLLSILIKKLFYFSNILIKRHLYYK